MNRLKLALMLGIALALGAAVGVLTREPDDTAARADAAHASQEPAQAPDTAPEAPEVLETPTKTEPASLHRVDIEPWTPPRFEYELEVCAYDEGDEPARGATVLLAPAGHTLNDVGSLDADGRLVVKWLAFEPRMQVDVALEDLEGLRRVELAAGRSCVALAKPGDAAADLLATRFDDTAEGAAELARALESEAEAAKRTRESGPLAMRDSEGRVQFVEPLLYAEERSAQVSGSGRCGMFIAAWDPIVVNSGPWRTHEDESNLRGEISGRLIDSTGAPVARAPVFVRATERGFRQMNTSDADGRFSFTGLRSGAYELRAGGGDFGRANGVRSVQSPSKLEWDVVLDRGLELKGRFVDARDVALRGWHVRVETMGERDPRVDVATTDDRGGFAIPNLPREPLRLFARGPLATIGSELPVAESLLAGENELTFKLDVRAELAPGALVVGVSGAVGSPCAAMRAFVVREDCGGIVRGSIDWSFPQESDALAPLLQELTFRGLEPGSYSLVVQAAGREPLVVEGLHVASQIVAALPALPANLPARLKLPRGSFDPEIHVSFELVQRGATVELHLIATDVPGACGFLRPGDYRIVRTLGFDSSAGWLRAEAGVLTELE